MYLSLESLFRCCDISFRKSYFYLQVKTQLWCSCSFPWCFSKFLALILHISGAIFFVICSGLGLYDSLFYGGIFLSLCGFSSSFITCFLKSTISRLFFMLQSRCHPESAGLPMPCRLCSSAFCCTSFWRTHISFFPFVASYTRQGLMRPAVFQRMVWLDSPWVLIFRSRQAWDPALSPVLCSLSQVTGLISHL